MTNGKTNSNSPTHSADIIVSKHTSDYNKLYFDKIFAFTLEIAAFSM